MKEIIRSLAVGLTLVTGNVFTEENYLRFFIGGVGVAYMQEKRYGISKSGSHWQFAVNLGVGYEFNNKWSLEAKWRHFSNGATSYPNPGKDFYSVDVGYRF